MNEAKEKRPVKLRRRYQSADGQIVPGVTTVTGLLNKPSLVRWANKLGLEGVEVSARTEQSARIGTLVHAMIQAELLGRVFDPVGAEPAELEQAQQALSLYHAWREQHSLRPIHCETSFVSERLRFGEGSSRKASGGVTAEAGTAPGSCGSRAILWRRSGSCGWGGRAAARRRSAPSPTRKSGLRCFRLCCRSIT